MVTGSALYAVKPHTIAETMILPVDMVKTMCWEAEAQKLTSIPLSDNTVKLRIDAIVSNQEETLTERVKTSQFMLSKWTLGVRAEMR